MRLEQSEPSIWDQVPIKELAIVAILVLGLIGGFYNLFRESSRLFAGRGAVAARPAAGAAGDDRGAVDG